MSLVGNFAFNNYDATADRAGAVVRPSIGRRMSSNYFSPPSSPTEEEHRGLHRTKSSFSQRRLRSTQTSGPPDDAIVSGDRLDGENKVEEAEDWTSDEEDRKREDVVLGLARKLTELSTYTEESPFDAGSDSKLNHHSKNFNAKAWA